MAVRSQAIGSVDNLIKGVICTVSEIIGDAVYFSFDNTVSKANASDLSTSKVIGFIESKQNDTECTVRIGGILSKTGIVAGNRYFLSTTSGQISSTPPTAPGNVVVKLGTAKSTELFHVEIASDLVIRA